MLRARRWLLLTIVFLAGLLASVISIELLAGPLRADTDPRYVDGVLLPQFIAAFNGWLVKHPSGPDRYLKLDVKDRERWEAVRETFKKLDREMKDAGY
jgi:hypothetical protein